MGNIQNVHIQQRGKIMYDMVRAGYTLRQIGRAFGISSVSVVTYSMDSRGYPTSVNRPPLKVVRQRNGTYLWENKEECIEYIIKGEEWDEEE